MLVNFIVKNIKTFIRINRTPKYICRGQRTKNFFTNSCTHFFQGRNYDNVSQILKKEINFWPTLQKLSKKEMIYMIFLVRCTQI